MLVVTPTLSAVKVPFQRIMSAGEIFEDLKVGTIIKYRKSYSNYSDIRIIREIKKGEDCPYKIEVLTGKERGYVSYFWLSKYHYRIISRDEYLLKML